MKKNRTFLIFLLTLLSISTFGSNLCLALSTSTLDQQAIKTALEVGPENMIRFGFRDYLYKTDYKNPREVHKVQQHIANLYPNRPDLYKRAACTLGKCLDESGKYTKSESERVVKYIIRFSDDCYNRRYVGK